MNTKTILAMAVLIMAASAIVMSTDAEQSDADDYFTVVITAPAGLFIDGTYWNGSGYSPFGVAPNSTYTFGVLYGGTVYATAFTAVGGYQFDYWTVNGSVNSNETMSAGLPVGSQETTLNINLYAQQVTPATLTLTVTGANGGEVNAYRGGYYFYVDSATYTNGTSFYVTPGEYIYFQVEDIYAGHGFVRWTVNGNSYTTSDSFGLLMTSSNVTVSAVFTANKYTVSFAAGSNGSVSVASIQNVPYGSAITVSGNTVTINGTTVTATADAGYMFAGWSNTSGTVTANRTITASFTLAIEQIYFVNTTGGTITITSNVDPTINIDSNDTYTGYLTLNSTITITGTALSNYAFDSYSVNSSTELDNPLTMTFSGYTMIIALWVETTTFNIQVVAGAGGSVTLSNFIVIPYSTITINGDTLYLDAHTVQAIPNADYSFSHWSVASGTQVTGDMTITAFFTSQSAITGDVYWNNGLYNGSIDMVFQYQPNQNYPHTMIMPLYTGTTTNNITIWSLSGYTLEITTSYPALYVTATLKFDGSVVSTNTIRTGSWSTFQLTIDTAEGKLEVTPVNRFTSFIDYTLYDSQKRTVLDWSNTVKGLTVYEIAHTDDTSSGSNAVRFSVTSTQVFLETYGIVLNNPSINVYDYFPQYESVRLNMYSFAIYGDTFSVNGQTYPLDGANVTIYYVNDGSGNHYLPAAYPNEPVRTKTMELSNIYVSWDALTGHCSLTFANDRFTIDLGTYSPVNETVSFTGMWYFATAIYSGKDTTQKELGPWKILPDLDKNQMLIIFLGVLTVIGVAAHIKLEAGIFDLIIIGLAALVAFLLLG